MSMSAKPKHDEVCFSEWLAYMGTHEANSAIVKGYWQRIERALSLLAAVESSGDEIVRNAKDAAFFLRRQGMHTEATSVDTAGIRITLDAQEKAALKGELERERMRLCACGVVAMANTPESAAKARQMHEDYRSASLSDVERAVDAEMALKGELAVSKLEGVAAAKLRLCEGELASVKAQRDQAWKVIEAGVHLDDAVRQATAAHPKE